jgi:hypothetical protein
MMPMRQRLRMLRWHVIASLALLATVGGGLRWCVPTGRPVVSRSIVTTRVIPVNSPFERLR